MQPTPVNPQTGTYTLPGTGIAGYQVSAGTPTGFTPYGGATPYFQPVQFTGAQYQDPLQVTNLPTFAATVGKSPGQYDEFRTYINDAGQTLQIPFKDGKPLYPIPEGYRPIGDEQPAQEEEQQTTVDPVVGEAQVIDEGGGDRDVGVSGTGYKGLSTIRGTGTGGLSAAAEKARTDLGITGYAGIPGGGTLGAVASAFGFDVPTAFGKAPQSGMTGTLDQATLEAVAKGQFVGATGQSAIGLSQQQALNVMAYEQNYGVTLNGVFGYKPGNINPTTGTAVGNHGMTVDSAFAGNGVTAPGAAYASISDMMDTISKGTKSGWRGGYVSQNTYNNKMTPAQQANYDNFDPSHKNAKNEAKADAALEGITGRGEEDATKAEISATEAAIESMTSGKGIPADVQAEIDAAMAAHEAKSGKGDSPSSPSTGDTGTVGGQPGSPGSPGMGGAAPGGAPGAAGPDGGGGGLDGNDGGSTEGSGSVGDG